MTTRQSRKGAARTGGQKAPLAFWVLGNRLTVLADREDTGGRYDLIEGRQPPGNRTPPHLHTRYDERVYVVDGELTIWAEERKMVLHFGDTFNIPAGTAHVVAATGEGATHALVVASPSGFAWLIEEAGVPNEGGAPPEPTPEDLERFQKAAAELGDEILGPPGALPTSPAKSG